MSRGPTTRSGASQVHIASADPDRETHVYLDDPAYSGPFSPERRRRTYDIRQRARARKPWLAFIGAFLGFGAKR